MGPPGTKPTCGSAVTADAYIIEFEVEENTNITKKIASLKQAFWDFRLVFTMTP